MAKKLSLRALNRSKRVNRSKAGTAGIMTILLMMAAVMAIPMILIIGNSFKPLDELWLFPPRLIPTNWTLDNFRDMFTVLSNSQVPFLRYIFNTVLITVAGTAGNIIFASMCAYVLAKRKFPGSNVMFRIIVTSLMFNATVSSIINYVTISYLGWLDTYWALIVPAVASPLGMYLMKQFMEQIPDALLEAARVDGASQWRIFWQIVMPNVKSAWLTLMLLSVQNLWALGATPYIYKEVLKTLPYALGQITSAGIARAGVGAAVTVVMMIVPISVFVISQSNVIETMSSSGIKE
ncbi:MAG: carbohydrate ABC transporter permease [Clostridia bacterium]|nr:carbohydrate ABC transporter permease [Clostridia bacterium]